jgi:hypothetical protein
MEKFFILISRVYICQNPLMGGGNKDEEELAAVSFPFIFLSKFYPS